MMQSAECPECGKQVTVGSQSRIGQLIKCKGCGAELEVVWTDPIELDWPMMEEFSDDDYEDEAY